MSERQLFSAKVVIICFICMAVLVAFAAVGNILDNISKSQYDKARERVTTQLGDFEPVENNAAFNLFRFNTDQIHSDELIFPAKLTKEFASKHNEHFYNPVELYMEYQGHDWDGKIDDKHSLVFDDGSTVTAEIHNGALHLRYYDGWIIKGKNTLLSMNTRDLWVTPEGKKLWRNDGRIFAFDYYDVVSSKKELLGTLFFVGTDVYDVRPGEKTIAYESPFNYDHMIRWCSLESGVMALTIQHDGCTELWKYYKGEFELLSGVDWNVDIAADNFGSAHSDRFMRFTLPTEVITIAQNGSVVRETITARE